MTLLSGVLSASSVIRTMASHRLCPKVTLALFLLTFFSPYSILSEIIIEESCDTNITLRDSDTFTVSNWTSLRMRGPCSINITADSPNPMIGRVNQLMFSILKLQTAETGNTNGSNERAYFIGGEKPCPGFRLDIINADSHERITPSEGLCPTNLPATRFVCDDDKATLVLTYNVTSNTTASPKDEFRLLVVRFHSNPCDDDQEFECGNHRCVSSSLKCNGENDCGDESDETDGCLTSTPVIIIIMVTSVIFIVAVIAATVVMFKRSDEGRAGWGEARLLIGAASINDEDRTDTRHVTRPVRTRTGKPEPQIYGATSLEIAD